MVIEARRIERPECEPAPNLSRSVSPVTRRTRSLHDPEPVAEQLGEAGRVPLPARQGADHDLDQAVAAAPSPRRVFLRRAALQFDIAAEADAALAAARPRLLAPRREAVPIRQSQGLVEDVARKSPLS